MRNLLPFSAPPAAGLLAANRIFCLVCGLCKTFLCVMCRRIFCLFWYMQEQILRFASSDVLTQVLVELAMEREEDIPALIYEARPVVRPWCCCAFTLKL